MYQYVSKANIKPCKAYCEKVLTSLQTRLKKQYAIEIRFQLIGSGADNMVTRNGNAPYDLDYNIEILQIPKSYMDAPGKLKDTIRGELDRLIQEPYSCGKDSTSSITYLLHSADGKKVTFSFDIALIWYREEDVLRLIHDKKQNRYIWNQLRDMGDIAEKTTEIRKAGKSQALRETYLRLKNQYLKTTDDTRPSFIVYAEAVNEVFGQEELSEENNMANSNQNNQDQFGAGMEEMYSIIQTLNRMSDRERHLYLTGQDSCYYGGLSIADCIKNYDIDDLEDAVDQYLTDNLELGDIFIRKEDSLEYLVVKYENNTPGQKTYRCLSLRENKEFCLQSINEVKRTKKHINIDRLRAYFR